MRLGFRHRIYFTLSRLKFSRFIMFAPCSSLFAIVPLLSVLEARVAAFNLESLDIYRSDSFNMVIEASIKGRSLGEE